MFFLNWRSCKYMLLLKQNAQLPVVLESNKSNHSKTGRTCRPLMRSNQSVLAKLPELKYR